MVATEEEAAGAVGVGADDPLDLVRISEEICAGGPGLVFTLVELAGAGENFVMAIEGGAVEAAGQLHFLHDGRRDGCERSAHSRLGEALIDVAVALSAGLGADIAIVHGCSIDARRRAFYGSIRLRCSEHQPRQARYCKNRAQKRSPSQGWTDKRNRRPPA